MDKTKAKIYLEDCRMTARHDFRFKPGDKVTDGIRDYMILSGYIENREARYTCYPPGKKSVTSYHVWIREAELVART